MRTIATSSKTFTSIETSSNKIAASRDDGTLDLYDSVTGVLRLSLNLADTAQDIRGSPDGSLLFCTHKTPSITV